MPPDDRYFFDAELGTFDTLDGNVPGDRTGHSPPGLEEVLKRSKPTEELYRC